MYSLKEIFYTIQGEGMHTGRPAIFLRFAGCNLWSGQEKHRMSAICKFCDTDFVGTDGDNGGKYSASEIVDIIKNVWPKQTETNPFLVLTGGEPALQLDEELINAFKVNGFYISIETNGTIQLPSGLDWICVSPKSDSKIVITRGNELKLVYPQPDAMPEQFIHLNFDHFSLQPMDGPDVFENTKSVIEYCKKNPTWKVSLQTHKILGIP